MTAAESKMGHTPGPWRYRPTSLCDWGWVTNACGEFIAQAKDPEASDEETLARHRAAGTDPWEANARLIAAAPDLLKAAKRALNVFKAQGETVQRGNVLEALESAITKATGAA